MCTPTLNSTWLSSTLDGPGSGGAVERCRAPVGVMNSAVWQPFSSHAAVTDHPGAYFA
jgi:hypothetical protein